MIGGRQGSSCHDLELSIMHCIRVVQNCARYVSDGRGLDMVLVSDYSTLRALSVGLCVIVRGPVRLRLLSSKATPPFISRPYLVFVHRPSPADTQGVHICLSYAHTTVVLYNSS